MRISDWISYVCSSDYHAETVQQPAVVGVALGALLPVAVSPLLLRQFSLDRGIQRGFVNRGRSRVLADLMFGARDKLRERPHLLEYVFISSDFGCVLRRQLFPNLRFGLNLGRVQAIRPPSPVQLAKARIQTRTTPLQAPQENPG